MILSLDFETYSECDITKCGVYAYAAHHSTEALMIAYAVDDGPVELFDFTEDTGRYPTELYRLLGEADTLRAFNATFERLILRHCLGFDIPVHKFKCTQVEAFSMAFSGSMEEIVERFNLGVNKDPRGRALINKFSKPQSASRKVRRWTRENAPQEWEEFKAYCRQDVVVERNLARRLAPYAGHIDWSEYHLSEKINDTGAPVDVKLIHTALELNAQEDHNLVVELKRITGLSNPNSTQQMLSWLKENGVPSKNLDKAAVSELLQRDLPGHIRHALKLRQMLAKTSVSKWQAFERTEINGRCHGMFQFCGAARTGRYAGRLVQLQNLPRGGASTKDPVTASEVVMYGHDAVNLMYRNVKGLLSDTIRCAIASDSGLLVSDLSSIESRVLGWVSDCRGINEAFAKKLCTYKAFAVEMLGVPYDQITKDQRTLAKPAVLGGGYRLGYDGLIAYAEGMGVRMTPEQAKIAIDKFRAAYHEIVNFWSWCEDSVFTTTRTGVRVNGKHGLYTEAYGEFLRLWLPSGRFIAYYRPRIEPKEMPWGGMKDAFTFMGINRFNMKWERIAIHSGGVTENIVQALARDILQMWLKRANDAGFKVVGHVHDELICEGGQNRLDELNDLIRQPIPWAPELLLDAAGFTTKRYRKD